MIDISLKSWGGGLNGHVFFERLIAPEHLIISWNEFRRGKEGKLDVQEFGIDLEENLFALQSRLASGTYEHGGYDSFYLTDPKLRHIHKPKVVDRVLHHALVRLLEPMFEPMFIFDSYSSRKEKGTHRAIARLRSFAWALSKHDQRTVWALKCDVRKFFDSVDHVRLMELLKKRLSDKKVSCLLQKVVMSFETRPGKGIPLGNLTSQLFSNIYLNELDQFVKRTLRVKYYIRYADDFIILSQDKTYLEALVPKLSDFLSETLSLELHPQKVTIRTWRQGIDFLGYVVFPHYTLLRPKTQKRILKKVRNLQRALVQGKITPEYMEQAVESFYGMLHHCRGNGVFSRIETILKE